MPGSGVRDAGPVSGCEAAVRQLPHTNAARVRTIIVRNMRALY